MSAEHSSEQVFLPPFADANSLPHFMQSLNDTLLNSALLHEKTSPSAHLLN
jgi:hypothetical protein